MARTEMINNTSTRINLYCHSSTGHLTEQKNKNPTIYFYFWHNSHRPSASLLFKNLPQVAISDAASWGFRWNRGGVKERTSWVLSSCMAEKLLTVSLDTVMRKVTNGAMSRVKKVRRVPRASRELSQPEQPWCLGQFDKAVYLWPVGKQGSKRDGEKGC